LAKVALTPASGSWPGAAGSGGTSKIPTPCLAMSCGSTPMCVARNGRGELQESLMQITMEMQAQLWNAPNRRSHRLGVGGGA